MAISNENRMKVREQYNFRCGYCGVREIDVGSALEIDHFQPTSQRGSDELDNLVYACPACNRYKAVQQTAVDPLTNQTVSLFHPQQQRWLDHFVWNEDATQIVGTTAIGRATVEALKMNRSQLLRVRRMWVKMGEHPPG